MSTDWKTDLRQRGYRLTPQRQLVLEAVDTLEHATPDDILVEVHRTASGINISTVYRTLELLEELELVSHAHLGHGAPTYHLADRHRHIHLVCRDCSDVIEADLEVAAVLTDRLRERFGFETDMKHFAIFGRCKECSLKGSAKSSAKGPASGSAEDPQGSTPGSAHGSTHGPAHGSTHGPARGSTKGSTKDSTTGS